MACGVPRDTADDSMRLPWTTTRRVTARVWYVAAAMYLCSCESGMAALEVADWSCNAGPEALTTDNAEVL